MQTKLTLTIDKKVIRKAKEYASNKRNSLSKLVENYFRSLIANESEPHEKDLTPAVKSLMGSFRSPKDFDYKKNR